MRSRVVKQELHGAQASLSSPSAFAPAPAQATGCQTAGCVAAVLLPQQSTSGPKMLWPNLWLQLSSLAVTPPQRMRCSIRH